MPNRLLTEEQIKQIKDTLLEKTKNKGGVFVSPIEVGMGCAKAQDAKTLKAVGEWLEVLTIKPHLCAVLTKDIEALKEGRWPE